MTSSQGSWDVVNVGVLVVVQTVVHVGVIGSEEEAVSGSLVLEGGVDVVVDHVLGGGWLRAGDLGVGSVEELVLEVVLEDRVDVHVSDWVDWVCVELGQIR